MITFNNIVSKFQDFCDDHFFIKTFTFGSPSDVDLDKFEQYPLLHLVYTGGDYNSPKAKTYNLEVYILSLPPSKADKVEYQKENISNAEQVAEDILADIQNGGNIFQFGFHYDLVNASVTPLEETQSNALAGCLLDIAISVPYTYDSCNAPLTGVEPAGSTTPAFKARGLLRVREEDGSPDVLSVATINVPNGSLTDDGDGEISLDFGRSSGQVSTFNIVSTFSQFAFPGNTILSFGGVGVTTITQTMRAGWSMGVNSVVNANTFNAMPTTTGSTFTVTLDVEISLPSGSVGTLGFTAASGYFVDLAGNVAIIGTGSYESYTLFDTVNTVSLWQLTNSIQFQVQNFGATNGTIRNPELSITMNHA